MGKNHGERERVECHYNNSDTMGFSGVLRFRDSNPPPLWKGSSIYAACVCLDKIAKCSSLFKHLTAYLIGG